MVRKPKLCVSLQSLVIGKDRLHRRITNAKLVSDREFYTIPWCILVSFLETFIEISHHFYDFMKCFNVSLHLDLSYWNITTILERILVWRFMVHCCGNGSWCVCIAKRIWNNDRWYPNNWLICGKCLCEAVGTIFDILFMWDCGSLGESP